MSRLRGGSEFSQKFSCWRKASAMRELQPAMIKLQENYIRREPADAGQLKKQNQEPDKKEISRLPPRIGCNRGSGGNREHFCHVLN
jgi:hypothetical protein